MNWNVTSALKIWILSFSIAKVQKVLVSLDLTNLQDVRADVLSGGQKRKLSLGIAILGNPQVGTGHIYTHSMYWVSLWLCILARHEDIYFAFGTPSLLTYGFTWLLEGSKNLRQWELYFKLEV